MACCDGRSHIAGQLDMPPDMQNHLELIFNAVDTNGDGFIDADEADILAQAIFHQTGQPFNPRDFKNLLTAMDADKPFGKITRPEFFQFALNKTNVGAAYCAAFASNKIEALEKEIMDKTSAHRHDLDTGKVHKFIDATQEKDIAQNYSKIRKLGAGEMPFALHPARI